jgi:hypothetical protein
MRDFLLVVGWFVLYPVALWCLAYLYVSLIGLACAALQ